VIAISFICSGLLVEEEVVPTLYFYNKADQLVFKQDITMLDVKTMDDLVFENGGIRKRAHPRKVRLVAR